MDEKNNKNIEVDFYIYEDKSTESIKLFVKTNKGFQLRKNKKYKDIDYLLSYTSLVSKKVDTLNLYTNIENLLKNKKYDSLKHKPLPTYFKKFLQVEKNKQQKKNFLSVEIDFFEKESLYFVSIITKTNAINSSIIKPKEKKQVEEKEVFNYLKDIVEKYYKVGMQVNLETNAKKFKQYFNKKKSKIKEKISTLKCREINKREFINSNIKEIKVLINNHIIAMERKNNVIANENQEPNKNKILIYTDASTFIDRPKKINKSGYGTIVKQESSQETMFKIKQKLKSSRGFFDSNVSEGQAIYESLVFLKNSEVVDDETIIELRSDSLSYITKLNEYNCVDSDIIKTLDYCKNNFPNNVVLFKWIKGHASSKYNNMVDKMAKKAIDLPDYNSVIIKHENEVLKYLIRNSNEIYLSQKQKPI